MIGAQENSVTIATILIAILVLNAHGRLAEGELERLTASFARADDTQTGRKIREEPTNSGIGILVLRQPTQIPVDDQRNHQIREPYGIKNLD